MKKYFNIATVYLIIGLLSGVFYREFTKLSGFEGATVLSSLHTHLLILGFFFMLIVLILDKVFNFSQVKGAKQWLIVYNVSLLYFITTMVMRGVTQVTGAEIGGLSHISGLAHALLGGCLIWFIVLGNKMLKANN